MGCDGTMARIIGRVFGLADMLPIKDAQPPFLGERDCCLVNARFGLALLVEQLSPGQVWLPSYFFKVMLRAVQNRGARQRFYEVEYDLTVPSHDWLEDVLEGDLLVLIDYFGFPTDSGCVAELRQRGAWIVEDACQAALSRVIGQLSHFVLFSPRKFLGVPDGGILLLRAETMLDDVKLESPPAEWWLRALLTVLLRREFDHYGGSRRWFQLYQETEAVGTIGTYAMSKLSRLLLLHSHDYQVIAQRRIRNHEELARVLGTVALFPNLPSGVVPLGFPIRVEKRDSLRRMLFEHEICPPVHWPIEGFVPESYHGSHRLAASILTLPRDQRHTLQDMVRMADLVRSGLR